ncbi:hypothetical protein FORC2_p052 (plasmid) [Yersinia enterocolitica]|nr:hypothetical protein FORC2_p052 [Yersinia enterocolitica]
MGLPVECQNANRPKCLHPGQDIKKSGRLFQRPWVFKDNYLKTTLILMP